MTTSDVNSVCDHIHSLVQMSGLHFIINQTPWSSYITIRRKFVNPGGYSEVKSKCTEPVVMDQLKETIKDLENKLSKVESECVELEEEYNDEKEKHKKTVDYLNSKIDTLEKERNVKDEIIQNINSHFNTKVSDLNSKVEELEAFKKETYKTEKKVLKKQRQKCLKVADKSNIEPEDKDINENILSEAIPRRDLKSNILTDLSDKTKPLSLPVLHHTLSKRCSPARGVPTTPSRRCSPERRPLTTPSPHTPPCLTKFSSASSPQTLACYFNKTTSSDLVQDSTETDKPFITTEYIKSIGKLSLVPRQKNSTTTQLEL